MNINYCSAGTSSKFLSDEDVKKVEKLMNEIRPLSKKRKLVSFVEPLASGDNFSNLDSDKNLVSEFLERNKKQYPSCCHYSFSFDHIFELIMEIIRT
jgi:hypothetical protein